MSDLETMLSAYVTCALWSSNDESDDNGGEPMDRNYDESDIAEKTMASMRQDCETFLAQNEADIGGDASQAGHDLWLTRNHHGAGFWDGDWPKEAGERLTKAADKMSEFSLYVGDDGKIHGYCHALPSDMAMPSGQACCSDQWKDGYCPVHGGTPRVE